MAVELATSSSEIVREERPSDPNINEMAPEERPSDGNNREVVSEECAIMPVDLFQAALDGDGDFLVRNFQLPEDHTKVTVDDTLKIEKKREVVEYDLGSVTAFGDTVLHILVANKHNDLALQVFKKDASLLKARNKMLETPLHCAAIVGNVDVIRRFLQKLSPIQMKVVLEETNIDGDNALHLAVKHGYTDVGEELLKNSNGKLAFKVNKKGSSPLQLAILENQCSMFNLIIGFDNSLASTQFSNGLFPVHVAASVGNTSMIMILLENYRNSAKLLDKRRQNFFHIAANEKHNEVFTKELPNKGAWLLNEKDCDGNTPLHIAAQNQNFFIMKAIWESLPTSPEEKRNNKGRTGDVEKRNNKGQTGDVEKRNNKDQTGDVEKRNNKGQTAFDIFQIHLRDTTKDYERRIINKHVIKSGKNFSPELFDWLLKPEVKNRWERVQVIGLGSVLVTTISFAAAFTFPGGYDGNTGTPILRKKFMFLLFSFFNAMAFVASFFSVLVLVIPNAAVEYQLQYGSASFLTGACYMLLAFGAGSYLVLASVNIMMAVFVLLLVVPLGIILTLYFTLLFLRFSLNFYLHYRTFRTYGYIKRWALKKNEVEY